jgi:hypothetical protein
MRQLPRGPADADCSPPFSDEAAASNDHDLHFLIHMFLLLFPVDSEPKRFCFQVVEKRSVVLTDWPSMITTEGQSSRPA